MRQKMHYHVPDCKPGEPCKKCGALHSLHIVAHVSKDDPCSDCGLAKSKHRPRKEHVPEGDPCTRCGEPYRNHRANHIADGDPCYQCGLPASKHRPARERSANWKKRHNKKSRARVYEKKLDGRLYVGIDGEGTGRKPHRYVFLGAASEDATRRWHVENPEGLSTKQCLDLILSLPNRARIFSFAFFYDLTMMLKDLPDAMLYKLARPNLRKSTDPEHIKKPPFPVEWEGYELNLIGTKFTVRKGRVKRIIWDIFKFYQAKFTAALEAWNGEHQNEICHPNIIQRIKDMKDKRSDFDALYKEDKESIWDYCLEECALIARLAHKLVKAHKAAGIPLTSFYGAGSSASAMLDVMEIKEKIVDTPKAMQSAVASAFFGGRFENSVIGTIDGPIYNYDISSAYPYQLMFLPCLEHGTWTKTKKRSDIEKATTALVRYKLTDKNKRTDWGPFPFREKSGSISYPRTSPGGWVWREEYLAGERSFEGVKFREAWVYHTDCDCQPFRRISDYYRERIRIGKEGPGIVLKLGMNSCYGKLAQSVGSAIFNSWIWAGLITSGTRAQILEFIALHKDPSNVLMIATDGVFTKEKIDPPKPKDTNTWQTKKPLGGWEEKIIARPIFVARPGIYFPMNPTEEEIKTVRARGLGKITVLRRWKEIVDGYNKHGIKAPCVLPEITRFCGIKTSITRSGPAKFRMYRRAKGKLANGKGSDVAYGDWIERKVEMSFDPMPKRTGIAKDGTTLILRKIKGRHASFPYDKAEESEEARELRRLAVEAEEQPNGECMDDVVAYGI